MLEHEQAVNRLLGAGRAERVPAHRFRRAVVRHVIAEDRADRVDFGDVASRRARAVGVDVVDTSFDR